MKSIGLLLTFSIFVSANCVNAQDKPTKNSKEDVVVEKELAAVKEQEAQLQKLQQELQQANAEVAARATQLQAMKKVLAAQKKQAEAAQQQVAVAHQQAQKQRKLAEESLLQADKAMAEAQHAKRSQELGIHQYKALLEFAEKRQGPEHAYSQALRAQLNSLEMELARMSAEYGPGHPKVAQAKQQIEMVQSQLKKMNPEANNVSREVALLKEDAAANTKALQANLERAHADALSADPEAAEKLRAQVAALNEAWHRAAVGTRRELAAKENVELLQLRRTQELLEMQKRLLSAQNVAKNPVVRGRSVEPVNTAERFDRLEQKLDRIASLLEELVDRKE